MFHHCIFCHRPFPENESLEHLRRARRVAYDPARGRLWQVCGACRGWTLVPFESRWEALEELERLGTDRARLLAETDNVCLLSAEDLEIVRVGAARRPEEAWWRYGREFERRRKRHRTLEVGGYVGVAALFFTGAFELAGGGFMAWWMAQRAAERLPEGVRFLRFGSTAWRGTSRCPVCGETLSSLPFKEGGALRLAPHDDGVSLLKGCPACEARGRQGGFRLGSDDAERVLQRVLAYQNFAGAGDERIRKAARAIEERGSGREVSRHLAERRKPLDGLDPVERLALEIAVNEESERRLLQLEVEELERRWREEEEIAAIVDGELTPVKGFERMLRRIREGS